MPLSAFAVTWKKTKPRSCRRHIHNQTLLTCPRAESFRAEAITDCGGWKECKKSEQGFGFHKTRFCIWLPCRRCLRAIRGVGIVIPMAFLFSMSTLFWFFFSFPILLLMLARVRNMHIHSHTQGQGSIVGYCSKGENIFSGQPGWRW